MPDRKPKKTSRPLKRTLHIGDQIWTYQLGDSGATVRSPEGKKTKIGAPSLLEGSYYEGYTWDGIERARQKGNPISFEPSMVKRYIEKHLSH